MERVNSPFFFCCKKDRKEVSFATFFPGSILKGVVQYTHPKGKSTYSKYTVTAQTRVQFLQRPTGRLVKRLRRRPQKTCFVSGLVVQWQTPGLSIRKRGFDSHPGRFPGPFVKRHVQQKHMQIPFKYFGAGSIPAQAWPHPAEKRALLHGSFV